MAAIEEEAIRLAQSLVRIPSESDNPARPRADAPEAGVTACLEAFFRDRGIGVDRQPVSSQRENVVARLARPGHPRILIAGHMDTVTAVRMRHPFEGSIAGGKLHGRGACDDKGPLAAAAASLANCAESVGGAHFDITFLATVGEETTMAGAAEFASQHAAGSFDLVLVLEPTRLVPITAHKAVARCSVTVRGISCHSATPEKGDNAILKAMPVVQRITQFGEELAVTGDPRLGSPTVAVTQIHGGTVINAVPDCCALHVDMRLLPSMDPADILARLEQRLGKEAEMECLLALPGLQNEPAGSPWESFEHALRKERGASECATAHYATDAAYLGRLGPTVVWGPGDIAQAHGTEEYVELEPVRSAVRILTSFLQGG